MTKIIGGKCDGQESPVRVVQFEEKGETYLLMSFKHENVKHSFFMLTGMIPVEAQKTYCERAGLR